MVFLFALAVLIIQHVPNRLLNDAATASAEIHRLCLRLLPTEIHHGAEHSSIFCGESLSHGLGGANLESVFVHLFLLSGSQLFLIRNVLRTCAIPESVALGLGGAWAFVGQGKITIVRPLVNFALRLCTFENSWRADQRLLWAGILCLVMNPANVQSLGLIFGWTAALAFCGPERQRGWQRVVHGGLRLWVLLTPFLAFWRPVSPLGLLVGLIVSPMAFPPLVASGALAFFSTTSAHVFDRIIDALAWIAQQVPPFISDATSSAPSCGFAWVWLISLHGIWHWRAVRASRRGT